MMRTFVVADIQDEFRGLLPVRESLGSGYYDDELDIRFLIIPYNDRLINCSNISPGYDGGLYYTMSAFTDKGLLRKCGIPVYVFERTAKFIQMSILHKFISSQEHGRPIRCITHQQSCIGFQHLVDPPKQILVKPNHGARSMGHIRLDLPKLNSSDVSGYIYRLLEGKIEGYSSDKGCLYLGFNESENEGIKQYTTDRQGLVLSEYVPDVTYEYRLISDAFGNIAYVQPRYRKAAMSYSGESPKIPYMMATGAPEDHEATYHDQPQTLPYFDEIQAVTRKIGGLLAFDLFYTSDNRWGIFEYSCEFGTVGFYDDAISKLYRGALRKLYFDRSRGLKK